MMDDSGGAANYRGGIGYGGSEGGSGRDPEPIPFETGFRKLKSNRNFGIFGTLRKMDRLRSKGCSPPFIDTFHREVIHIRLLPFSADKIN